MGIMTRPSDVGCVKRRSARKWLEGEASKPPLYAEQLRGTTLLSVAGASPRPFGEDQRSIRVKSERGCNATRPGPPASAGSAIRPGCSRAWCK
jgi:hypothetical protein